MSSSSTVQSGQHDTKYVTFELLVHAAFVADEIWGFMLESARNQVPCYKQVPRGWTHPGAPGDLMSVERERGKAYCSEGQEAGELG